MLEKLKENKYVVMMVILVVAITMCLLK